MDDVNYFCTYYVEQNAVHYNLILILLIRIALLTHTSTFHKHVTRVMEEAAYHAISVACPWISWIGLIFHSVDTDSCFVVGSGGMHKEQIYFKDGQLKVTPLQDLTLKELSAISKQAGCVWFQSITQQNVGRYLFS